MKVRPRPFCGFNHGDAKVEEAVAFEEFLINRTKGKSERKGMRIFHVC